MAWAATTDYHVPEMADSALIRLNTVCTLSLAITAGSEVDDMIKVILLSIHMADTFYKIYEFIFSEELYFVHKFLRGIIAT